jgi:anti-sigma factor RsiW
MENEHLTGAEVAGYLEGALPQSDRRRVEAHLAACDECCSELIEVAQLLRTQPRRRDRRGLWYVTAGVAAAAGLLLILFPRAGQPPESPGYREPVVTTTVGPVIIAPRGETTAARAVVWRAVPHAERYRLTLFDVTGTVIWQSRVSDTVATLPATIELRPRASYFWQVEAQTAWNRWVRSDLVEFSVTSPRP